MYSVPKKYIRVFARVGDKKELNMKYPDNNDGLNLKAIWQRAKDFIKKDKRPRVA